MADIDFPDAPVDGQVFNEWRWNNTFSVWEWNVGTVIPVEYVVVAGGGGGSQTSSASASRRGGGGGGAGGYRSNVSGENSGGGESAERQLLLGSGTYRVTIAAGGAVGARGSDSFFGPIYCEGGGRGGSDNDYVFRESDGLSFAPGFGGSGGGAGCRSVGGSTTYGGGKNKAGQGFGGGQNPFQGDNGAGGGGAGALGANNDAGGTGGVGVSSSITGTATFRAGGGGGGWIGGAGGNGGGGRGSTSSVNGTAGATNTGGGGGGAAQGSQPAHPGGSGVVIFRVPTGTSVSFSGGVTHTTTTVSDKTAYIVTAAGPTDTVTIG